MALANKLLRSIVRKFSLIAILAIAVPGFVINGCAPTPKPKPPPPPIPAHVALKRIEITEYPHFSENGDVRPLLRSINMSQAYLKRLPSDRRIEFGADHYPVSHLIASLDAFAHIIKDNPSQQRLNQEIQEKFHVYQSVGRKTQRDVLFTGYYEPLLTGDLSPGPKFKTPVHSKPKDMVEIDLSQFAGDLKGRTIVGQYTGRTVVPYPTRKEIRHLNDFNDTAPPIAWLRDEVDLLILQIQGSGRVLLANGEQKHILYNGSNGRPYRSIGRRLIDKGLIPAEKMSMQAIRDFLKKRPELAKRMIDYNPRYIFFKTAQEGPLGALGQPLTPMRSLAVDRKIMPSAALAFITTPLPSVNNRGAIERWTPYNGFALAQDAGSAIKGPGRIDLFMGHGLKAEVGAGHLKHSGEIYFLILKPTQNLENINNSQHVKNPVLLDSPTENPY